MVTERASADADRVVIGEKAGVGGDDGALAESEEGSGEEELDEVLRGGCKEPRTAPDDGAAGEDGDASPAVGPVAGGEGDDAGDEDDGEREEAYGPVGEIEVAADILHGDSEDGAVELVDGVEDEEDDEGGEPEVAEARFGEGFGGCSGWGGHRSGLPGAGWCVWVRIRFVNFATFVFLERTSTFR